MSMEGAYTQLNYQGPVADFGCLAGSTRIEHGYYSGSGVWVFDGIARTYCLVKAAATGITKNTAVIKDSTSGQFTVIISPSSSGNAQLIFGVNNTGESITSGNYFWLNMGPEVFWIVDAGGVTVATAVMPSNATAGTCEAWVTATTPGNVPAGLALTTATSGNAARVWARFPVYTLISTT